MKFKLKIPELNIIKLVLIIVSIILFVVLIFLIYKDNKASGNVKTEEYFQVKSQSSTPVNNTIAPKAEAEIMKKIKVEINGEIAKPGIYEIDEDTRLGELIEKAGGLGAKADSKYIAQNINYAKKLLDEEKVYLPSTDDTKQEASTNTEPSSNSKTSFPTNSTSKTTATTSTGASAKTSTGLININKASLEELDSLPGIGPATAQKIVNARPFKSIEDLKNVSGIGDSKYSDLKSRVSI